MCYLESLSLPRRYSRYYIIYTGNRVEQTSCLKNCTSIKTINSIAIPEFEWKPIVKFLFLWLGIVPSVLLSIFFIPSTSLQSFAISRLPRNSDKILRIPVRFIGYSIRLDFLSSRLFFENNIFLVVVVVSSSSWRTKWLKTRTTSYRRKIDFTSSAVYLLNDYI